MGIGLNSGPVMSGNVGSERRLEYTAVGDTTNTAARIEQLTKGTPHQLHALRRHQGRAHRIPPDDLVFVEDVELRGRRASTAIWSLTPEAGVAGLTGRRRGTPRRAAEPADQPPIE